MTYAAAEQQARAAKLGLWQDSNPTAPGDWRQDVKAKRWGPPPPEGYDHRQPRFDEVSPAGLRRLPRHGRKNRVFFKTVAEAEAAGYKRAGNCPAEPQARLVEACGKHVDDQVHHFGCRSDGDGDGSVKDDSDFGNCQQQRERESYWQPEQ